MELDFEIDHRAGIKHQAADTLYRLSRKGSVHTMPEDDVPVMVVTRAHEQASAFPSFAAADGTHADIK